MIALSYGLVIMILHTVKVIVSNARYSSHDQPCWYELNFIPYITYG